MTSTMSKHAKVIALTDHVLDGTPSDLVKLVRPAIVNTLSGMADEVITVEYGLIFGWQDFVGAKK